MAETLTEILQEYKRREKRKRVVLSLKIDPQIAQMLADAAEKAGLSKTVILESFICHGYQLLAEEEEDRLDLEAAQEALKEPGTVTWEKVKAEMGL